MKGSVIRPGVREMLAAVSTLTDSVNEQTVTWFSGQPELRDSAVTSTKRKMGGGYGFGGDNSLPIEAAAIALWGAKNTKRDPNRKMRVG
jgi:xanthine dehydrogenase molybdopterin-binding subunit B